MRTFNIHAAKMQLSRLVDEAAKGDSDVPPNGKTTPEEEVTYNYKFDNGQNGSTQNQGQKSVDNMLKQSSFDKKISVEKILIQTEKERDLERDSPAAWAICSSRTLR